MGKELVMMYQYNNKIIVILLVNRYTKPVNKKPEKKA